MRAPCATSRDEWPKEELAAPLEADVDGEGEISIEEDEEEGEEGEEGEERKEGAEAAAEATGGSGEAKSEGAPSKEA